MTVAYGQLTHQQVALAAAALKQAVTPSGMMGRYWHTKPLPAIHLRSKKKRGQHRIYQLWMDGVYHGEFPSNKARRAYIDATRILEESIHGERADTTDEGSP